MSPRPVRSRTVLPVDALGEEALPEEASEAGAGDVDGGLVGGHAEKFVQLTEVIQRFAALPGPGCPAHSHSYG